jgi:hypothetical protein
MTDPQPAQQDEFDPDDFTPPDDEPGYDVDASGTYTD